jgi:hypothetical protein
MKRRIILNTEVIEIDKNEDVEVIMSKDEAVKLTQDIKSTTTALYVLLKRAHDDKAWVAMGYKSWTEYIENEFNFSRTRSYQLINQATVIEELDEASGVPMYISEREARAIKNRLPEITEKIQKLDKENMSDDEIKEKVQEIIEEEKEEVDMANKDYDGEPEPKEDNSKMEEWKPEGIDMEKMKKMLSDEDQFFYNNLITTLKIFKSMPEATKFGQTIKNSSEDTKELKKLAEFAFSWITQILDEIE